MIIELLGPDGVGKTTFAKDLALALKANGANVVRYQHRTKIPLGADGSGETNLLTPANPRPRLLVVLKVLALYRSSLHFKQTVQIRERFFTDIAISPWRYRIAANDLPSVKRLEPFLRKRHIRLLLIDDPIAIHSRKPELSTDEINEVFSTCTALFGRGHYFDFQIRSNADPGARARQVDAIAQVVQALKISKRIPHRRRSIFLTHGRSPRAIASRALVSTRNGRAWWVLATVLQKDWRSISLRRTRMPMITFYKSHASRRNIILFSQPTLGRRNTTSSGEFVQVIAASHEEAERERRILELLGRQDLPFDTTYKNNQEHPLVGDNSDKDPSLSIPQAGYAIPNSILFDYAPRLRDASVTELTATLNALRSIKSGFVLIHNDFTYWNFYASSKGPVLLDCGECLFLNLRESALVEETWDLFSYIGSLGTRTRCQKHLTDIRVICEQVWTNLYSETGHAPALSLKQTAAAQARRFEQDNREAFSTGLTKVFGKL